MGREQERIKKRLEKNPIEECNKIQRRMYPELFSKFAETKDPRNQSYITYPNKVMLATLYYKGIAGITSMQAMTSEFNNPKVVENLGRFMNIPLEKYLPHHFTENEYLGELEEIQKDMVYQMIRKKNFNDARFMKKCLVIVDGTELYSGKRKLNDKCLERHYNKDTEKETINYYSSVLDAKIYFGDKLITSIAVEFIENNSEDTLMQKKMNVEEIKQDSETKGFIRLAKKIKNRFPRLPIILLGDSLYASKPVMDLCALYNWDYIIRFKEGSIPSIVEDYEAIPEKDTSGQTEYINDIDYKDHKVNVLRFWEERLIKGKTVQTNFQWLTSIRITKKNGNKIAETGRKRWKIENEGFNRQKNWQGDITHVCSWNEQAQKKISSDLLESFAGQLTREDIAQGVDTHSVTIT